MKANGVPMPGATEDIMVKLSIKTLERMGKVVAKGLLRTAALNVIKQDRGFKVYTSTALSYRKHSGKVSKWWLEVHRKLEKEGVLEQVGSETIDGIIYPIYQKGETEQ